VYRDVSADDLANHVQEIAETHRLVTGKDDAEVAITGSKNCDAGLCSILDMDVFAQFVTGADDFDASCAEGLREVAVDTVAGIRSRSIQRAVAENRVVEGELALVLLHPDLARLFAGAIEAARFRRDVNR